MTVDEYIASAPEPQQPTLTFLRDEIRRALPQAQEAIETGVAMYKVDGRPAVGFAKRAKSAMLYCIDQALLDRYEERLGRMRSGKACVELKGGKGQDIAGELIREIAQKVQTSTDSAGA